MAQYSTPPVPSAYPTHRSLALSALLQQLEPGRKYSILDLGQAIGQNVTFWSQFPVRIHFPDFYESLVSAPAPSADEEISYDQLFEQFLFCPAENRFDIILGWDLFNYLEPERLESLIRVLRRFCIPGTYVFVLMSTLHQIPAEPTRFRIHNNEHLIYENHSPVTRPCPRYQPRDIKLMMAGFDVLVSFLLRHGVQEYLFVCQDLGV